MKRLFVALKIQPDSVFFESFRELKKALTHEKIKWVEEHQIHITLKFLGETQEALIPEIIAALNHRAVQQAPFGFSLHGLGIFGSSYSPRVVWVGIEPFAELSQLMRELQKDLAQIGFEADRQNLVPHLTLGRIKSLNDRMLFHKITERHKTIASLPLQALQMILFESLLKREGPEYRIIESFNFVKNAPGILL